MDYDIPMSVEQCRSKLRDEFAKHRHINDIRVIDMLVIKVRFPISYAEMSSNTIYIHYRVKWN